MHYGVSVTNVNKKIVPMAAMRSAPAWVTATVYAIGDYVKSNGLIYMATAAGTSGATVPTGVGSVSDGTVTWVSCLQHPRKGITIVNEGTLVLYLSMAGPAVSGAGLVLAASGGSKTFAGDEVDNCEFFAIRAAATAGNVAILEW